MARKDDVVMVATELLREQGPASLTSIEVAARLGVTQPAIYRHVRDMHELTDLASHALVGELTSVLVAVVHSPETAWGDGSRLTVFAERLVRLIGEHQQAFAVIARWRYDHSELGHGIRTMLGVGRSLIAAELEHAWRADFGHGEPFDEVTVAAQLAHAELLIDDVVGISRSVDGADGDRQRQISRTLSTRLFTGWCSYVLEMNTRLGIPVPELGGPMLSSPEFRAL